MVSEPRWKTWAWRLLYAILVLWVVTEATTTFVIWAFKIPEERFGRRHKAQFGERCGPEHHWVYVGMPGDPDLSCEPDRP
jgi:hypothetical protein